MIPTPYNDRLHSTIPMSGVHCIRVAILRTVGLTPPNGTQRRARLRLSLHFCVFITASGTLSCVVL